ncbi:hypothetical protein AXG93_2403s1010 [Marchantia polymorpha subsp. ruderalis]|uniref:Uncharacterized protein n=1 Tax=Marchantia polymorpha subsp. ruderalis TaxID=1480154 RepID=A0A176VR12_MARPO|nr:hypothetical protein AXG93_2403s1010 [Marchantia polymorpha subsp. ruderalis]
MELGVPGYDLGVVVREGVASARLSTALGEMAKEAARPNARKSPRISAATDILETKDDGLGPGPEVLAAGGALQFPAGSVCLIAETAEYGDSAAR